MTATLGATLRELRLAEGLSLRAAGHYVKCSPAYLSKIENGIPGNTPSDELLARFASLYKQDVEHILAMAGRLPATLAERAATDYRFAQLLRRLPYVDDATMRRIYKTAGI